MVWLSSSSNELTLVESVIAASSFWLAFINPNSCPIKYVELVVATAITMFSVSVLATTWSFATLYIFIALSLYVAPSLYAVVIFFENFLALSNILLKLKTCTFWIIKKS